MDPKDDPGIPDEAILWRRIPPRHFVLDDNRGVVRPSSAAFNDHPDGSPMSVLLADVMEEKGRKAPNALIGHDNFALSGFAAGLAREYDQAVAQDPTPEEPAHALVVGRKTRRVRKALAHGSEWVIPPTHPADLL